MAFDLSKLPMSRRSDRLYCTRLLAFADALVHFVTFSKLPEMLEDLDTIFATPSTNADEDLVEALQRLKALNPPPKELTWTIQAVVNDTTVVLGWVTCEEGETPSLSAAQPMLLRRVLDFPDLVNAVRIEALDKDNGRPTPWRRVCLWEIVRGKPEPSGMQDRRYE